MTVGSDRRLLWDPLSAAKTAVPHCVDHAVRWSRLHTGEGTRRPSLASRESQPVKRLDTCLALIVRSEGVGPRRGITTIDQDVAAAVAASSVEQI